ncbi:MAG: serine/threonine protein kinase [Deltaproteobacteria bacterium]|nr:serine/threonine protein kinase [Deltaproteobacteria bacterium]
MTVDDSLLEPTIAEPMDALLGMQIGRYSILEKVAKGGTATVYRALDTVLKREVAVKILHEHLEGKQEVVERFRNEAQVIAQLRDQNIVNVFDFLEHKGRAILVVEYMPGVTLSALIKNSKRVPEDYVLMIGYEILQGLKAAHHKGVTHRDIKPANILINPDLGIKISDFGLAKIINSDDGLTKDGIFVGTPSFSSPEQIEGKPIDHRTDIFSLGLTLYVLATRSHAFKNQGDSTTTVWFKIVKGRFESARVKNPDLSPDLEKILNRSLEVAPEKRYQSAEEMAEAIATLLKSRGLFPFQSQLKRFLNSPDRITHISRKKKDSKLSVWLSVVGVVGFILALWFYGFLFQARHPVGRAREVPVIEGPDSQTLPSTLPAPDATEHLEVKPPEQKPTASSIKTAVPVTASGTFVFHPEDKGPGYRLKWSGSPSYAISKDRNFSDIFSEGESSSRKLDLLNLPTGNYFWRTGRSFQGQLNFETFASYRDQRKAQKNPLTVSSNFGDVDLEINPWIQDLKLVWQAGPEAASYHLELSNDPQFRTLLFSGSVVSKSSIIERFWDRNQTIFWRVSYLDEGRNVFLVEPTRKINLKIKGSASAFDVLQPQAFDVIKSKNLELRAIGPDKSRMECAIVNRNQEFSKWTTISKSGSFYTAKLPIQAESAWLVCETRRSDQIIYFTIPFQASR